MPDTSRHPLVYRSRSFAFLLALLLATAAAAAEHRGVHVLRAADYLSGQAQRPFDLAGSTLVFTPAGSGYTVTKTPLQYEHDTGSVLRIFQADAGNDWQYVSYSLSHFTFPFAGSNRSLIYPYVWGAVFFLPPPQFSAPLSTVTLNAQHGPAIAPFLLPRSALIVPFAYLYARETADTLYLTWTSDGWGTNYWDTVGLGFNVQLQIRRDGTILFSYLKTGDITWPAVGLWPASNGTIAFDTDLSVVASAPPIQKSLPIAELFSLAGVDTERVRADVETLYGYHDTDIDAIAIYEDFDTDLVYYAAAYCNGGNAGVDGLMLPDSASQAAIGSRLPRRAAVMQMGNFKQGGGAYLFLHELGHRWLYYFSWVEGGVTRTQNGHPTIFTETTAAFPTTPDDRSPLGGFAWIDRGDGTFTAKTNTPNPRYSWHELYFLGLAAEQEVQPWFYIDSPQFISFGSEGTQTYRGTRKNMTLDSVILANGRRVPPYATSQKTFRIVLVFLARDPANVSPEAMQYLIGVRDESERQFGLATGGRGSLEFLPPFPRRVHTVRR